MLGVLQEVAASGDKAGLLHTGSCAFAFQLGGKVASAEHHWGQSHFAVEPLAPVL